MTLQANVIEKFDISLIDYPDPKNWAVAIYFCGCDFKCSNCSNLSLRDPSYSEGCIHLNVTDFIQKIDYYANINQTNKLVFLGGDPLSIMSANNAIFTQSVLLSLQDKYDVCIYTGHTIDYVKDIQLKGFKFIKCGQYTEKLKIKSEKTDTYLQFASTNQELYDSNYKQLSKLGKYYF